MTRGNQVEEKLDKLAKLAAREFGKIRKEMATKTFVKEHVEGKIDELAQATERAFQNTATKEEIKQIVETMATKDDLKEAADRLHQAQESMLKVLESMEGRLEQVVYKP